MTSRPSTAAPILAVLAVVLVPLAVYVVAYFGLGTEITAPTASRPIQLRIYRYRWQVTLFAPAVNIDSYVRGSAVHADSNEAIRELLGEPP